MITGGQALVAFLEVQGVERLFCVPGESYLPVLDALYDSTIQTVVCRHEGAAAMMAEASGKLSGRPGIALVTRGPGATNASAGVHVAEHDSTPLVLLVGQVERGLRGRGAFQEVDYGSLFGGMAKWVAEIDQAGRIPEMLSRAYHIAMSGRPGPVVLALPEDMLSERMEPCPVSRVEPAAAAPLPTQVAALERLLANARRPLVVLGGSRWDASSVAAMRGFSEVWSLPVACSFRRQMLFDHLHPNYAGDIGLGINPALAWRVRDSDLLLLIGGRMAESPSQGYRLLEVPGADGKLIHIHPGAEELGRVYQPRLACNATPDAFLEAVSGLRPAVPVPWSASTRAAHDEYLRWSGGAGPCLGRVDMNEVMRWLEEHLPDDAVLTNGAGNYTAWLHRFHRYRQFATQLAPVSGSMGYGLPAAIAAKLMYPDRLVICFAGDGCFQMTGQEFATAVQYGVAVVVLLVDNGSYGTIRMHQERRFPGRVIASTLRNPDFAVLARACGGHGETVVDTREFAPALLRAQASGKPAIVHLRTEPEAIAPGATLSTIRETAMQSQGRQSGEGGCRGVS